MRPGAGVLSESLSPLPVPDTPTSPPFPTPRLHPAPRNSVLGYHSSPGQITAKGREGKSLGRRRDSQAQNPRWKTSLDFWLAPGGGGVGDSHRQADETGCPALVQHG